MTRTPGRRLSAALIALLLVVGACGDDEIDRADTAVAGQSAEQDRTGDDADDHDGTDGDDDGHDGGGEPGATEVDEPAQRLLVADADSGSVLVLDLVTGDEIASLELGGPASLYTEPHGRYVIAAQRDDDRIDWIDSGVWTVDHGGHGHYWAADPAVTDWGSEAAQPTHVVFHDDLLAVFNDGDGSYLVIDTHHLGDDDALVTIGETGEAHHGVAVAIEELGTILVTAFDPDGAGDSTLPDTVVVVDLETGTEVERFDGECPGLHGEYSTGDVVAFGCTDGVLLLEWHGDHWASHKVAPPAETPDDARAGTLRGGHDLDYLIGNLGRDALVRIDLDSRSATVIELPTTAAAWSLDSATDLILVLDADGSLHTIDARTGAVVDSIELTDSIDLPSGHGGPPRPSITVGEDRAYLAHPADELVIEIAFDGELREARRFEVGVAASSLAVAGQGGH
jgi:DNA-binding beta-propeller fold protein YncE